MIGKGLFSIGAGYVAQTQVPEIPGLPEIVEKAGVWGLAAMLMWWVLGKLSKQLDSLESAIDRLAEKINND